MLVCVSCQRAKQSDDASTIDPTLQIKVDSILLNKLIEIDGLSGQVIIMEVQSGQIKALVGLKKKDDANYQECENFAHRQESGLMHPISLLAALETGKVQAEQGFDTGDGILVVNEDTIRDHNWKRGGYQYLSNKEGIMVGSNIMSALQAQQAFGDNPQGYFAQLDKMSYGKPDKIEGIEDLYPASFVISKGSTAASLAWTCIGYNQLISPIQTLTFYNAIANGGVMVKPQLYKGSVTVINPQIASKANLDFIKGALTETVSKGLGKPAASNKVLVAGKAGNIQTDSDRYIVSFCGYFPANDPQYSMIVVIDKEGLPVSGGVIAGDVFGQVVEEMILYVE